MNWSHEYALWHEFWFGIGRHILQVDNLNLIEEILETTDFWTIVPLSAAKVVTRNRALRYIILSDPPPDWPIYLLTKEPQNEYTKYLVEDFLNVMNDLIL